MSEIIDFGNEKRKKEFLVNLEQKNTRFTTEYLEISPFFFDLEREYFGEIPDDEYREFIEKPLVEKFENEQALQQFVGRIIEKFELDNIKKEVFTFENNPYSGSVVRLLAGAALEKKYPEYKD